MTDPIAEQATLAIVTTCKGRLEHLKQTLPAHAEHAPVVLVDCGCPDKCSEWAQDKATEIVWLDMQLFYKTLAQNLGAAVASNFAPWLAFVDADLMLLAPFWDNLPELDPNCFYIVDNDAGPDYIGFLLVHRALFWGVGGYDIIINSWGAEDVELRSRLAMVDLKPVRLPGSWFQSLDHDDESRLQYMPVKDKHASLERNYNYINYKMWHATGSMDLFESERMQDLLELRLRRDKKEDSDQA
jgi:predicted glycosyltransferase involved in capsule biosynthesis